MARLDRNGAPGCSDLTLMRVPTSQLASRTQSGLQCLLAKTESDCWLPPGNNESEDSNINVEEEQERQKGQERQEGRRKNRDRREGGTVDTGETGGKEGRRNSRDRREGGKEEQLRQERQ